MKKLALFISCFLLAAKVFAQDCSHYLYLQKDKTIEMTGYNKSGDMTMKSVSKVSDVKTSDGITSANVVAEIYDKNGKLVGTSNIDYKCNGGSITMQMHVNTQDQGKKATDVNIQLNSNTNAEEYPSDMKVGDHLKDYTTQMSMVNGATATIKVTDRVVLAKESVTTTAGTWECFKISYKSSVSTTFDNKSNSDTTNKITSLLGKLKLKMPTSTIASMVWYDPGFGMIKTETKNSRMELTAVR